MKPCETHGRPDDGDGEKVINRNRCLESAVFWMAEKIDNVIYLPHLLMTHKDENES
jgi:hypothetical protein